MKSPIATNVHEYLFYDQGGYTFYLDQTLFGGYEFDLYDRLPVVFFYPLKTPLVESITPTKISYHKGINVFDIISDYPVEKAVIKM